MKVEFEIINPDEGSSFRFLHQKVPSKIYLWDYHYHTEVEIVAVLNKGYGTRHVGTHLSRYENGELVIIGSNVPHAGFGLNASNPHEEVVIQLKEEILPKDLRVYPEMKNIQVLLERSKYGISFSEKIKEEVIPKITALIDSQPFEKYIGLLEVLQIMAMAPEEEYTLLNKQIIDSGAINKHKVRLEKIFTYVEQHYKEDIDIQKVAALVSLSIPSFCNYFKKTTYASFTEFVNQYRIQKACLLLQQDKTISEASFECGFNNVTYFNKVFKSVMQTTPTLYRKERFDLLKDTETGELVKSQRMTFKQKNGVMPVYDENE